MEFIDFHTHTFPEKIAARTLQKLSDISHWTPYTDGTLSDTISKMNDWGLTRIVCQNIATRPGQETTINNTAAAVNEKYNGKITSLGSVHPLSENYESELERIKELGIPGIKMHPEYQEFFLLDDEAQRIYAKCSELGLFISFHMGTDWYNPDFTRAIPADAAKIAQKYPKLNIVLAHFGAHEMWDDVEKTVLGYENIYLDTALCAREKLDPDQCVRMLGKHPKENVFMGSDCPWECPADSIRYIDSLKISDDQKEMIFGTNAMKFLGLK